MFLAIVLAAVTQPCDNAQTQTDMNECWSAQAAKSADAVKAAYAKTQAEMRKLGIDSTALATSQTRWQTMQQATCAFEASLTEGGSMSPMEEAMCYDRTDRARAEHLNDLTAALAGGGVAAPVPVSASADAELNRVYSLLRKQELSKNSQTALVTAELDWIAYRDAACAVQKASCLTSLTQERTQELEDGWIGEKYW